MCGRKGRFGAAAAMTDLVIVAVLGTVAVLYLLVIVVVTDPRCAPLRRKVRL